MPSGRIGQVPACDASICAAFAAIDAARGDVPLTYFEFGTLAAFWLFAQRSLDALVLGPRLAPGTRLRLPAFGAVGFVDRISILPGRPREW